LGLRLFGRHRILRFLGRWRETISQENERGNANNGNNDRNDIFHIFDLIIFFIAHISISQNPKNRIFYRSAGQNRHNMM
jgi:hypothetical protein